MFGKHDKTVAQKYLNKIVEFMRKQGKGSSVVDLDEPDGIACRYRGPDGTMCAVGCLLTDEQISKYGIEEGNSANSIDREVYKELGFVDIRQAKWFFGVVQEAHDEACLRGAEFLPAFESKARVIAEDYGLTYPKKQ